MNSFPLLHFYTRPEWPLGCAMALGGIVFHVARNNRIPHCLALFIISLWLELIPPRGEGSFSFILLFINVSKTNNILIH